MSANSFFKDISSIPDLPQFMNYNFSSIVDLPKNPCILDLKNGKNFQNSGESFSIGKYNEKNLFALYGHLSKSSLENKKIGQKIQSGERIATIGKKHENGGWPPHVHFQLSTIEPKECDLPGVVSKEDHELALKIFPDPRLVLGQLY